MLVQQKKRQSFSIESLAISSHVEGTDRHHRRETDSPYLNYIQSENKQTASVDYNRNFQQPAPVTYNQHYDNQQQSSDAIVNKPTSFGHHVNDNSAPLRIMHPTSTPKMQSNKRKRTCSPQRMSPTSDESCDENMTIDTSSNIDDLSDGKISPISARSLSTMSEGDTESLGDDSDGNKRKKARTAFSGDQLKELERRYKSQKYLTASDRTQLARALKLKDQQVKTWFQNRRMKEKRQQREEENSAGFHLPTGGVDIAQLAALGICAPPQSQFLGSSQPLNFNFNSGISPASLDHRLQGQTTTRNGSEPPTQTSPQLSLGRTSPELSTNGGSMFSALDMRAANELRHRSTVAALSPGSMSGVHMPVPIMSQYVMSNMLHSPFSVPLYPH